MHSFMVFLEIQPTQKFNHVRFCSIKQIKHTISKTNVPELIKCKVYMGAYPAPHRLGCSHFKATYEC